MADISHIAPTEFIAIEIAASVHAARPPTVALAPVVGASDRLVDLLPAAVYVCDASGIVVRCNQRAVELWGRSPKLGDAAERFCGSYRLYRLDGAPLPHAECPVVDVLRTGVAVRDQEVVIERPDGSHVIVVANIEALKDDAGNIVGAVNCLYDITGRKRIEQELRVSQAALRESEERLHRRTAQFETLLNGAPLGVYLVDADLRIREVNPTALPLFGDIPGLIGRDFDEVIHLLLPKAYADETVARFRHTLETGEPYRVPERVKERPDRDVTEYYEWQINRILLPEGRHGVVCYFRDVSAQVLARRRLSESRERLATELAATHRLQEQQGLLLREMNHRIKNLFAVANGLLALSARSVRTPQELAAAVRERLDALARAHELVLPEWAGDGKGGSSETTLHSLIRAIFLPYARPDRTGERDCLAVDGPGVAIGAGAVTSMALLLHEFAVNSAKYGALSSPDGSVAIDWSAENGDLVLRWRERGGPAVAGPPAVEGFGSLLARRTVTGHFRGRMSHDWRPEGLTITLAVPLKRLG